MTLTAIDITELNPEARRQAAQAVASLMRASISRQLGELDTAREHLTQARAYLASAQARFTRSEP